MFGTVDAANLSASAADSTSKPRVLLADDHVLVREAIGVILSPWFRVRGVEGSTDMREAIEQFRPDVLVMDISLPFVNGLELAQQVLAEHPNAKIIFLTMHEDHFYVRKAFEIGAQGYVLKKSATSELVKAIETVLTGQTYRSPALEVGQRTPRNGRMLTARQRTVLRLVAEGKSAKQIAGELKISPRTAEFHKNALVERLGLHTTAELTRYALQEGLV
ncbi:MAG TPA: response regulator transcription factor [Bryobacteraceae bacterium]|jgi:DNA-binding NarL/FixJ family response regulator|nr:response regulator transcription factor [Bryobacteraceae bacterium]